MLKHMALKERSLPDDDGTVHFSGDDDAGEDTSTDRDFTSEGAFLVFPLVPTGQEMRYQYNFPRWLPLVS